MGLSRKEYVAICETCKNRKFDSKIGLLCGLTQEYAQFESSCPEFIEDEQAIKRIVRMKKHNDEAMTRSLSSSGPRPNLYKSGFIGGIALLIIGGTWLVLGLAFNRISFYSIFLILSGVFVMIQSVIKKAKELRKPDTSDILDEEFD